jgi:hypothetical protein
MVARRHHYVPRCYLKAFSVERKNKRQVQVFDKKTRRTFASATDNVALEGNFNTIPTLQSILWIQTFSPDLGRDFFFFYPLE